MAAELSAEEIDNLVSAFRELKVKPKTDSPEDLKKWMKEFAASIEESEIKKEPNVESEQAHVATGNDNTPKLVTMSPFPRLSTFSGDRKGGTAYELWKYELQCLIQESRTDSVVLQAIRTSLKGEAGKVIMRLGPTATTRDIISKMDSIYGDVDKTEMVLGKFYSARQQPGEDVSAWGCRLEDLLSLAVSKGEATLSDTDNILKSMFWNGMLQYLKNITGHLYESITNFDALRVAIRRVEQDYKQRTDEEKFLKKSTPAKSAVAAEASDIHKLTGMVNQLVSEVSDLKNQQREMHSRQQNQKPYVSATQSQQYQRHSMPDSRGSWRQPYTAHRWNNTNQQGAAATDDSWDVPTCWRCGQTGHLQYGCRVQLDHQHRRPLNSRKSAPRGRR